MAPKVQRTPCRMTPPQWLALAIGLLIGGWITYDGVKQAIAAHRRNREIHHLKEKVLEAHRQGQAARGN